MGKHTSTVRNKKSIPIEDFNFSNYTKLHESKGKIVYRCQCRKGEVKVDVRKGIVEPFKGHTNLYIKKNKPYNPPKERTVPKVVEEYENKREMLLNQLNTTSELKKITEYNII